MHSKASYSPEGLSSRLLHRDEHRHPLCCVSPGRDAPAAGAESEERAALRQLAFLHAPPACASFSCRFSNCAQPMPARPFRVRKDAKSEGQLHAVNRLTLRAINPIIMALSLFEGE